MARDPQQDVEALREKIRNGERDLSERDAEALDEFARRMALQPEAAGWLRQRKMLRHAVRIAEHIDADLVDVLDDRAVTEAAVTWIQREYDIDETPETNKDYRAALRKFAKVLGEEGELPESVSWVSTSYPSDYDPQPSPGEMLRWDEHVRPIIDACQNPRDKAMHALCWDAGARSGEIRGLTVGDVADHEYGLQIHVDGKMGQRSVTLIPSVPFLNQWLAAHPRRDDPHAPLWCNLSDGSDLSYRGKLKILKEPARRANVQLPAEPTFTRYRKSSASHLASRGVSQTHLEQHHGWARGSDEAARYIAVFGGATDRELASAHGLDIPEEDEPDQMAPIDCPRCDRETPSDEPLCVWCGQALDAEVAGQIRVAKEGLRESAIEADDRERRKTLLDLQSRVERDPEVANEVASRVEDLL